MRSLNNVLNLQMQWLIECWDKRVDSGQSQLPGVSLSLQWAVSVVRGSVSVVRGSVSVDRGQSQLTMVSLSGQGVSLSWQGVLGYKKTAP